MNYGDFVARAKQQHGVKFDDSSLNPAFISAFNSQERITVDFGYETKRGRIGVTSGWKPCFLLLPRVDSTGSSYTINQTDKIIRT